ncbi:MAG: GYD domain-containing protein [Armatimonadota bacterium]
MPSYVLLTKLPASLFQPGSSFRDVAKRVADGIKAEFPDVRWVSSYAVLGPYDLVDVFEAPDNETASRVALLIRRESGAETSTMAAVPWDEFIGRLP